MGARPLRCCSAATSPAPASAATCGTTIGLYKALRTAGVVRLLDEPDEYGRCVEVDHELQDDFALNQLLAPFLLARRAAARRATTTGYPLAVLALVEAVVDNPFPILMAQKDKAKDEAMAEMKAAGVEYEQRIEELEKIQYPQPMRDQIYDVFDRWRATNPWIGERNIAPKGVVRDLWDRAMDFPSFVRHYGIKRSEGLLLRYLSDVYKTMLRTVPDEAKTPEVDELQDWLGAVIRATDSSLLDEWTALFRPDEVDLETAEHASRARTRPPTSPPTAGRSGRWCAPGCSAGCSTPPPASGRRGPRTSPRSATGAGTSAS